MQCHASIVGCCYRLKAYLCIKACMPQSTEFQGLCNNAFFLLLSPLLPGVTLWGGPCHSWRSRVSCVDPFLFLLSEPLLSFQAHKKWIGNVFWIDRIHFLTSSTDGCVRIWDSSKKGMPV